MISTITVNNANVTLVSFPTVPGLHSFEIQVFDAVSTIVSPFTGQVQAQQWPGADMMKGTATLAPLKQANADAWVAFLKELRGMSYAFQMGDPLKQTPRGTPSGTPTVDSSQNNGNPAMSQWLGTTGWTPSTNNLLLPNDYVQIGYRLYSVLDAVNSDGSGNALIQVWPSLREQPTNGTTVITSATLGLWRLANNTRTYSFDITKLTHLSFQFQEYR